MLFRFLQSITERHQYLVIITGIGLFFVLALLPQSTGWVIVKILYFLLFLSFVYLLYHGLEDEMDEGDDIDQPDEIPVEKQDWLQIENDQDVEDLFQNFLDNSLKLIKKILVSDTVVLLFANYKKNEFTVRHIVTNHESSFIPQKTIDMNAGLPSLILRNRTALIENHLPQGQEIISYYKSGVNPSRSFAGIPVFFKNYIIGVLCIDTAIEEAYSNEDLELIKHFGHLITVQLFGSNKLYEYESENWLANILFEVSQEMNKLQSVNELWEYLSRKIPTIISCDRFSIATKLNEQEGKIVSIDGGMGNLKIGKNFKLNSGIVGWVLRKNQSLMVDDFSAKENYVPRFAADETPTNAYLSLLSLPVSTNRGTIAAVCLESYRSRNYKEQHKRILQTICNHAATIYYTAQSLDKLKLMNYKDPESQVENLNAFNFLMPKEIKRAEKYRIPVNTLFIKQYFQIKENNYVLRQKVIKEFLSLILPVLSETDYIFHLFPDTFALVLTQDTGRDIREFAEKLLERVSAKKIWADGDAFDYYVNIGIILKESMLTKVENLLRMGEETIKQARLKGPNHLAFYEEKMNETKSSAQTLT